MKKTITAGLAALALTLTACSENDGTTGTPDTTAATTEATEETTVEQATEPDTIAIGETVEGICTGAEPCDMNITITSMELSDSCTPWDDMWANETHEDDELLLDVEAEVEVIDAEYDLTSMSAGTPKILGADGFTTTAHEAYYCDNGPRESWGTVIDEGEKRRVARIFQVPEGAEYFELGGQQWEIPRMGGSGGTVESTTTVATSAAQQETNSSPAPAFDSEEWVYAPYGHDEYGLPHVPDHATDFERCSMLAGMECTDQMMSEWQAINDYAATQQDRNAGQSWWGECIAENTAEYCRANDPWQQ